MPDKNSVRLRALELIFEDGRRLGPRLASAIGVSRQVANGYLKRLASDGMVNVEGATRACVYSLKLLSDGHDSFACDGLEEDRVVTQVISPVIADLPHNVQNSWRYAASEMINNAIEHSGSSQVHVGVRRDALHTEVTVRDDGEGIFLKIQRILGLSDPREAILELAKGKLTTAPENHSGEGIFFTSRVMDAFDIESGRLRFRHAEHSFDRFDEEEGDSAGGTIVRLRLGNQSERTTSDVFDAYSDPEEYSFDKTVVPLHLAQQEGHVLVSRSQARRVSYRFEMFRRVELDFQGISTIGQAFADELFRVFARSHPDVSLIPVHCSPAVDNMIRRAVGAANNS